MKLRFHPAALDELTKSADWYALRSLDSAQRFVVAIDQALKLIERNPDRHARVSLRERGCRVKRFPYQIIYQIHDNVLCVLAVAHSKRRPGYWKRRR